jgi:arylsulfatase
MRCPFGKVAQLGPFDHWPTGGGGFQYFYGFVGGETHQYYPNLFEGTTRVEPRKTPEQGYTLNEDLADHTIAWVRQQKALAPDRPFFVYYAPGATHAPHHVPKEWADKYKGKFDQGWDKLREETFARQKKLGVIPKDCELTKRHAEIPAWDAVDKKMKPVICRQMEVYAGFMEQTDHHVGRVIDALADLGILDDTVIYLIIGDNGASAEGSLQGTFNEMVTLGGFGALETAESLIPRSTSLVLRPLITTTQLAGHMPWTRRINGPNKSPRTGAEPETARSFTGQTVLMARTKHALSSTMSSMSLRRFSIWRNCRSRYMSTALCSVR